jgi:hypothetical protein
MQGRSAVPAGPVWGTHLGKTTAEARGPAALGAGGPTAQALAAQDAVTALRVGAPRQVGAAFHIASQKGLLILWAEASAAAMDDGKTGGSEGSHHQKPNLPSGSVGAGCTLEMTSGEETMLRMKAPVGWAGQSAMGQVQFSTKFCSIRVVRYSFQQDCQDERRADQRQTAWPHLDTHPSTASRKARDGGLLNLPHC